jgi:hypothetical protein
MLEPSQRYCRHYGANSSGRKPRIGNEFQAWSAGFLIWQRGGE